MIGYFQIFVKNKRITWGKFYEYEHLIQYFVLLHIFSYSQTFTKIKTREGEGRVKRGREEEQATEEDPKKRNKGRRNLQ